jgi:uncharacterized protein
VNVLLKNAGSTAVESANVGVRWFRSARDIGPGFWKQCWPESAEGMWWYQLLEDSKLEDQFEFYYGLISVNGTTAGILPVFLMNMPLELAMPAPIMAVLHLLAPLFPNIIYQRTLFVGSVCADEGSIGLDPSIDLRSIAVELENEISSLAVRSGAPMIVWKDLRKEVLTALEPAVREGRLFKMVSYPGTVVDLPKGSFETYLGTLTNGHRHNLKKKLKRSCAAVELTTEIVQYPDERTIDEIFGLFLQTYERATTKFEKLTKEFFLQASRLSDAHFVILRNPVDNRIVAFMLCFQLGKLVINKFIGIDYARPKEWFLYFRLWQAAVVWSMSVGATQLQSGQTGYRPKIDVGHQLIPLFNLCKHRNPLVHAVYQRIGGTVSASSLDKDLQIFFEAHPEKNIQIPSGGESQAPGSSGR